MKSDDRFRWLLRSVNRYLVFFLLMSFIITCSMMLFVTTLTSTMGITLTNENISDAAKLTALNILFLSTICTVADGIRRKFTVDRPVRQITQAAQKIIQGDFSTRIPPMRILDSEERFNEIIGCFNKMAEELSGIETLRTDFIANVSHELKTPPGRHAELRDHAPAARPHGRRAA